MPQDWNVIFLLVWLSRWVRKKKKRKSTLNILLLFVPFLPLETKVMTDMMTLSGPLALLFGRELVRFFISLVCLFQCPGLVLFPLSVHSVLFLVTKLLVPTGFILVLLCLGLASFSGPCSGQSCVPYKGSPATGGKCDSIVTYLATGKTLDQVPPSPSTFSLCVQCCFRGPFSYALLGGMVGWRYGCWKHHLLWGFRAWRVSNSCPLSGMPIQLSLLLNHSHWLSCLFHTNMSICDVCSAASLPVSVWEHAGQVHGLFHTVWRTGEAPRLQPDWQLYWSPVPCIPTRLFRSMPVGLCTNWWDTSNTP